MKNMEGKKAPSVTFRARGASDWHDVTSDALFAGRTVVVFSLPGAFTPTCSSSHVPRYNELAPALRAAGVDEIVCMSVNDGFVMRAWQEHHQAHELTFLPDGNGEFTEALGMLVDKSELGFGKRSWRYSMLVRDGVVEKMFIEPAKPGDPFEVSDADTMLRHLGGDAARDIVIVGREGCSHCARARQILQERGLRFEEVEASPRRLRALSGATSTPQVFIDGHHIGGADALEAHLAKSPPA